MSAAPCKFRGPYLPVGDVDWVCTTHDVYLDWDRTGPPSHKTMHCPNERTDR